MTVGKHSMTRAAVLCVMVAATGGPLHAQAATPAEMAPVEGEEPVSPPICTDRPTKANVTCTVPAGEVQIESDAVNWTRTVAAESRSDTVLYTNPTVKYGLSSRTDLEANLAPYETIDTAGPAAGPRLGGIGDLTLRLKQRLSADGATTQITLLPFVKVPTARRGIGNGRVEGGVVLPVSLPIPGGFTLTLGPEVDVLADGAGSGYHAGLTSLATSRTVSERRSPSMPNSGIARASIRPARSIRRPPISPRAIT